MYIILNCVGYMVTSLHFNIKYPNIKVHRSKLTYYFVLLVSTAIAVYIYIVYNIMHLNLCAKQK